MKHLLLAVLLLLMVAHKSNSSFSGIRYSVHSNTNNKDTIKSLQGRWQLLPVMASDTATGKIPYLNFDLKTNMFSGNTGCNNFNGNFRIKQDAFQFGENMVSTKMACPGFNEKTFLDNLLRTNRYEIKEGVLKLMYNTTILSKWVRHSDTTITKQI